MSDEALKIIGEIQHVRLEPDDVLIVTCPGRISDEMYTRVSATMSRLFAGHPVVVLDEGVRLEVARRGDRLSNSAVPA